MLLLSFYHKLQSQRGTKSTYVIKHVNHEFVGVLQKPCCPQVIMPHYFLTLGLNVIAIVAVYCCRKEAGQAFKPLTEKRGLVGFPKTQQQWQ